MNKYIAIPPMDPSGGPILSPLIDVLKRLLFLDPTVRFERDSNQTTEVDLEKKKIYDPCIPYLSEKYQIPKHEWTVIGLLFGSRGAISKFTWQQLHSFKISQETIMDLENGILGDSEDFYITITINKLLMYICF